MARQPPDPDTIAVSDDAALIAGFSLAALPDAFYADPYPTYRALQSHDPIHRMPDGSLFLTRHRDLEAIYKDTAKFSSDKKVEFAPKYGAGSLLFQHHTTSLVFNDPPLHTRVRNLIAGALNPRAIAEMEPGLLSLVDRLLDAMQAKGEADLIEDFASAIPIEVIGNLLGVPHEDRHPLRGWSLSILGALEPKLSPEAQARGETAVAEFLDYLRGLVADRRKTPGRSGTRRADPADRRRARQRRAVERSRIAAELHLHPQCRPRDHHQFDRQRAGAAAALPDQRQRLIDDPSLIKTAIEEFLRFESSNQLGNRSVAIDTELGGVALPKARC